MRILNKVEGLLQNKPELRDSDRKLLLAVWASEGLHLDPVQRTVFMGCSTAETVTRARRALKAKYPASPNVDERRYAKYVQYKRDTNWRPTWQGQ